MSTVSIVVLSVLTSCEESVAPGRDVTAIPIQRGALEGHNVLVVTLDTVRADHLGCYGHDGAEDACDRRPRGERRTRDGRGDARFPSRSPRMRVSSPASFRPSTRRATQRRPPSGRPRDHAGRAALRGGIRDGGVRGRHRARTQSRARAGVRRLRRSALRRPACAAADRPSVRPIASPDAAPLSWLKHERRGGDRAGTVLHVGALLRRARSVRATEPVRRHVRRCRLRRRDRLRGSGAGPSSRGVRYPTDFASVPSSSSPPITARDWASTASARMAHLVYESTMHVPLIFVPGSAIEAPLTLADRVVTTCDVTPTMLDMLGIARTTSAVRRSRCYDSPPVEPRAVYLETLWPHLMHGWAPIHALRPTRGQVHRRRRGRSTTTSHATETSGRTLLAGEAPPRACRRCRAKLPSSGSR